MPVVIDASVAFHWTVRTQYSVAANRLIAAKLDFIAPDLIFPEMANAFHRVARVSPDLTPIVADGLQLLPRWFHEIVPSASLRMRALALARSLQHSVYDCFYLALAMERETRMVTTDERLVRKVATHAEAKHNLLHLDHAGTLFS